MKITKPDFKSAMSALKKSVDEGSAKLNETVKNMTAKKEVVEDGNIYGLSGKNCVQMLCYLVLADGAESEEAQAMFMEAGQQLDLNFSKNAVAVIDEYQARMKSVIDPEDRFETIKEGFLEAIKNDNESAITPKIFLWDMILLAFADGRYDDSERELLKAFLRKTKLDGSVLLEMESCARTLHDLEIEKSRLRNSELPYARVESRLKELDRRIEVINNSVRALCMD